jgi:hypothetical protein
VKTLTVNDENYLKARKLLADNGITTESESEPMIPLLRKSDARPGETPAMFGGIWADDERTMMRV